MDEIPRPSANETTENPGMPSGGRNVLSYAALACSAASFSLMLVNYFMASADLRAEGSPHEQTGVYFGVASLCTVPIAIVLTLIAPETGIGRSFKLASILLIATDLLMLLMMQ